MNKISDTVPKDYDKKTIREFLKEYKDMSTRFIRKAALDKRILVEKRLRWIIPYSKGKRLKLY